jgi:hypothetical protein
MGRRAKKWRSRALMLTKQQKAQATRSAAVLREHENEAKKLRRRVAETEELNCFRVAVRNLPFARMGDVYSVQVTFDPRMIEYGLYQSARDPLNLSRYVSLIAHELSRKVEGELYKQLVERNGVPA